MSNVQRPRIAIPQPTSQRADYNQRSYPQYAHAVEASGGEPVEIPLDLPNDELAKLISHCHGVLLPGSPADVDPQKYSAPKDPHTNPADPPRDNVDELLIQDAYNLHKPIFGICYGLQSLNVWRTGTLVQHIASKVDHQGGKSVPTAHEVNVAPDSRLAAIIGDRAPVNSSHHQSAETIGDGLRAVATCPDDGIIEAVEGTDPKHFVVAVQWHPERGFDQDPMSQKLFRRFIAESNQWLDHKGSENTQPAPRNAQ